MKRDMELVKALLEHLGATGAPSLARPIEITGFDDDSVDYHTSLCADAGYIEIESPFRDTPPVMLRLTWQGHDFLEKLRDHENWAAIHPTRPPPQST